MRMVPINTEMPKGLLEVNGEPLIERIIKQLHEVGIKEIYVHKNGINEIYVVVGYLKEQFVTLEKEYLGVKLIENPYYDTCNNIASLYVARDYIENAIILDGDQIIYNPEILAPEFERSGYNSVWTDGETDEWLQTVEDGIVTSCSRTGGKGGWQLYSISRWTAEDATSFDSIALTASCYSYHRLGDNEQPNKGKDIIWTKNYSTRSPRP